MDTLSPKQRSALMSRIKGRDTGPEMAVRRLLFGLGYRYRVHVRRLPGKPDIVFASRRVAIFIHGCFWHRHECGRAYTPKTRIEFWQAKFAANVKRDKAARRKLAAEGWRTLVIWECQAQPSSRLTRRLVHLLGSQRKK
jgi:DNA mismatch endonuclease (patch repair protein)